MRLAYNKLVRDRIPDIIAAAGSEPSTRILDLGSYRAALRAKLVEEAREAQAAPDEQLASELADVLEVLRALARIHAVSWEDVELETGRKRAERGGFDQRIFLEYVDGLPPLAEPDRDMGGLQGPPCRMVRGGVAAG
jgi:predicted house-cleaning noncanonical NTP pyrophosphatase (MazG superfamily)